MTANSKLEEDMGSDNLSSICEAGEIEEKIRGSSKIISVSDQVLSSKSDSFAVDMDRISHLMETDINSNSRITLQRNLSRKGSVRNGEMKITGNDRDATMLTTSPRATLHGGTTPEKPTVVAVGTTEHSTRPQLHHQITITSGDVVANESKWVARKSSFRRNSPTWITDPRRILIFFATLSSMGTILLIYFTLSMGKLNGDDIAST